MAGLQHGRQTRRVLSALFRQTDADVVAFRTLQRPDHEWHEVQGGNPRYLEYDHHAGRGRVCDKKERQLPFRGREGPRRCFAWKTVRGFAYPPRVGTTG